MEYGMFHEIKRLAEGLAARRQNADQATVATAA
jgi:hypothetical protein